MVSSNEPYLAPFRASVEAAGNNWLLGIAKNAENRINPGAFVISPWSASGALGMLRLGAAGGTEAELANYLRSSAKAEEDARAFGVLQLQLAGQKSVFQSANGLWTPESFPLEPSFVENAERMYGARLRSVAFPHPALGEINQFVSENTRGRISNFLDRLSAADRVVLVNACCFKDEWAEKFPKEETKDRPFLAASGRTIQVQTMRDPSRKFRYGRASYGEWAILPYRSGFSMIVMMPKEDERVSTLLEIGGLWTSAIHSTELVLGEVQIPKWKSEDEWDLRGDMIARRLGKPFLEIADFGKMRAQKDLYVSSLFQKALIEVDEQGTTAAAATGGIFRPTAIFRPQHVDFIVNRPFAYAIVDSQGMPIFEGFVYDPRSGAKSE